MICHLPGRLPTGRWNGFDGKEPAQAGFLLAAIYGARLRE
jgi:hypothetical protein